MAAVTHRYARALAEVVLARNLDAQQVIREMREMLQTLESSSELRIIWQNPAIPVGQKVRLLDALSQRLQLSPVGRNFIAVLIEHRRIAQLAQIVTQFEHELDARLGIAQAEVTSARELSPDERNGLESNVADLTGKKVRARYRTDGKLLGGVVVRVGSTIYDGSVRGQLEKMKEQLIAD